MKAYGSSFDYNRDGRLSIAEQSAEMQALYSNPFEDDGRTRRELLEEALEEEGYSIEDLKYMDREEVRELLASIGFGPED